MFCFCFFVPVFFFAFDVIVPPKNYININLFFSAFIVLSFTCKSLSKCLSKDSL